MDDKQVWFFLSKVSNPEERWCSCPANFTGRYCDVDVNECLSPGACSEHEVCINTFGSYKCFCEEGFVRDVYKCVQIMECDETTCMEGEICVATPKGFQCVQVS
ncbi:unnamed protein product [Larinioides sclopetarius]|uniref:EGF-like domain-containing protein n=1 Tax=Larinioides sclopetarius TaxID=280406 RepID=A0AAV2ANV9_9ARAC